MKGLREKAIKGVSWSFVDNIANAGITFIVGIILARILSPAEFGLIGMITIFIAVSNSIVDSGFSSALIRKVEPKEVDYNTVFYFNLCLGIVLYLILFYSAPAISWFFKEPNLISITRVMGTILIINAFGIVQRSLLVKEVDFKNQTKISMISSIISGIVGITMALKGFGVWSLVSLQISRQLLNTIFLWVISKWRPVLEFSKDSFQELFGFGSKLLISGLMDTIYNNIYFLIIGKYYSAVQLGQYTRAEQFNSIFSSNLTSVVQRVSYPVLCNIQDEDERLKLTYRRVIKATMLVAFTCMLGLAAIAKPLILLTIGEKWLPSVTYLQIICFAGMLQPLHAINLNMLMVKGRSDLFLRLEIIKKAIAVVPICLGVFYGIELMLWGSVFISFAAYVLNSYYSARLINYSIWAQIKDIYPSFLVSIFVAAAMFLFTLFNYSVWITLPLQCTFGFIITIATFEIIKSTEYFELKGILLSIIKRK
ncbi:lipopolysaccharide biosynthesis protein [Flavobacterium sp.]|uniref:lipopolysaccharide biosynthesis protein n=1 Tax=Flavobacterium sp. TaxID=239 RepID=UPI00333EC123